MTLKRWLALLLAMMGLAWAAVRLPTALAGNLLALDGARRVVAGAGLLNAPQKAALTGWLQTRAASSWRTLGMTQCDGGLLAECEATYRAALLSHPADPILQFRLANLLAATGREDEAIPLWAQAGAGPYWRARGVAKGGCVCTDSEGMCDLQRAARIGPDDGPTHHALGRLLEQCELWADAVAALSVAIDGGTLPPIEQHDALVSRAVAAYRAGAGIAVAESDIARAIALQPRNPWPHIRLCTLYLLDKQPDAALAACDRAVQLAPTLAFAYYYRGQVWVALRDVARARADYEQALAYMPDMEAARQGLARLNR